MSFSTLGLSEEIIKALEDRGYKTPTPIQKEMIPSIISGRDILASAQTGTGKSAAFILPILQMITEKKGDKLDNTPIRALIVVPTRELAKQVGEHAQIYCRYLHIESLSIYGGVPIVAQAKRLSRGVDLLISTPGRVLEHARDRNIDLKSVEYFILDEADTILDMGFIKEISHIIELLKPRRQNILVSATITNALRELSRELLHRPINIEIASMGTTADLVKLTLHPVAKEKKLELLSYLIGSRNYSQVLVFVRTKSEANIVTQELISSGLKTAVIHGDKSSGARSRVLRDFKDGQIRVLVATDIAARGLDIKGLGVVINYDIPHATQDFIHRIGRTGRAGSDGIAITLTTPDESVALKLVERMLGRAIPVEIISGYELTSPTYTKGARKNSNQIKKTDGAFGKKRVLKRTAKKRKTTKRDGFKSS